MAQAIARKTKNSNSECLIKEVMPIIVAMAPGPHMSGMASGTKAMLPLSVFFIETIVLIAPPPLYRMGVASTCS